MRTTRAQTEKKREEEKSPSVKKKEELIIETKSEWSIQPFWPLRFPYYIIDLDENYSYTVIGYPNRKLLWIMSREKTISNENFKLINQNLLNQGYDLNYIKIPHN